MSTMVLIPQSLDAGYQDQIRQLQDSQAQWLEQQRDEGLAQQLQSVQQLGGDQKPQEPDDSANAGMASGSRVQPTMAESDTGGVGSNNESAPASDESATTLGPQLRAMLEFVAAMAQQQFMAAMIQQFLQLQQPDQQMSGAQTPENSDAPPSPASGGDAPGGSPPDAVPPETKAAGSALSAAAGQPPADAGPQPASAPQLPTPSPASPNATPAAAPPAAAPAGNASPAAHDGPPGGKAASTGPDAAGAASKSASVNGGGSKSLELVNSTDKAMPVAFFRNLAPGEHPSFNGPEAQFKLPPHSSLKVSMPDDWQGRVQKWSGNTQDPSNWAEINFEKSTHKIWYDESDILGRNSSMTIEAPDGALGGSAKSLLGKAPNDLKTLDAAGNEVIKPPQWFDGKTNQQAVDFLDRELGTENAYMLPNDHKAVRTSEADSLKITFGAA